MESQMFENFSSRNYISSLKIKSTFIMQMDSGNLFCNNNLIFSPANELHMVFWFHFGAVILLLAGINLQWPRYEKKIS